VTATVSTRTEPTSQRDLFALRQQVHHRRADGHAKTVKTNGAVVRAAIPKLQPNSTVLVVLIKQGKTGHENRAPGGFSSVPGTLNNPENTWLRSALNPV
jgi:hypothetical protein